MANENQIRTARFGTMKRVQRKTTRGGKAYAIITVDCKKFEQVAYVFGDQLVAQVLAAGEGANVWFRAVIESAKRTNAEGRAYEEDVMKVVFFRDKSASTAEAAETADETAEAADPAGDEGARDEAVVASDQDEEVPF